MSAAKKTDTLTRTGTQSLSQKRRNKRKKVQNSHISDHSQIISIEVKNNPIQTTFQDKIVVELADDALCEYSIHSPAIINTEKNMNDTVESREKVKAAREAKKLAKQQAKMKKDGGDTKQPDKSKTDIKTGNQKDVPSESKNKTQELPKEVQIEVKKQSIEIEKDEVDRASAPIMSLPGVKGSEVDKEQIKAERAAKKASKQAKKKDPGSVTTTIPSDSPKADEMTVRDVIETLRDIKIVAQDVKEITVQVQALHLDRKMPEKKLTQTQKVKEEQVSNTKSDATGIPASTKEEKENTEDGAKSKAELRAERRAKQEAQRAAKEAAAQAKVAASKPKEQNTQPSKETEKAVNKEKSPKPKAPSKQILKQQGHKVSWFRHLCNVDDKAKLNNIPINSNIHPAIVKLGVQLATRVVTGSNARCIALLDALKKMVRDYSLPAKTEFGRGLEAHLASSLQFLWTQRQPTASQTNAVKFFRHHLTQLPNNVDEFDAKKTLQEEIDRYIREQIDMAGEAISLAVRNKISEGDNILTYGCSSLIERILVDAHRGGVTFRVVAVGAREMARRLAARRLACVCVDITALSFVMRTVTKVLLSASALLANGSVVGAAGTASVASVARAHNAPVLVACETHKFSDRVHTDAFLYNEIGDPDELIGSDENSPLKDWRSNPNLTPLNLTYDVTPPNLVTAVVTELAILPCTSAPVVLRFKLSEYSV